MSGFDKFLAYEASAGSGKTFNLVVRYLSLLFMGVDAKKILTLTFTNKASNEMSERIIKTLKTLEDRDELDVIVKVSSLSREQILEQKERVLEHFLNSDTKIMTIDKFFAQILRKFSLHAGLMPTFNTYESQHQIKLLSRFLKEVMVENRESSLIRLTLMANDRLSNIFDIIDQLHVKQHEIAGFEYKEFDYKVFEAEALSAVNELKILVQSSRDASATAKNSMDIDSYDDLMSKSWITKESLNYRTYSKCFSPLMDELLHKIQDATYKRMRAYEQSFFYEITSLLKIYERAKLAIAKEDNELSFDDITTITYYLLKQRVDSDFLYFRLDAKIEHILLDEFQDTSIIQFEILAPLIDEIASGEGVKKDGSFFFVGDVKQSIYRFRGGVSSLFHYVSEKYDVKIEPLVTNYRSDRAVVEFVNTIFRDKIDGYLDQSVKPSAKSGYVEVLQSDDVLATTLAKVQKLQENGVQIDDIAILCATNKDGSVVEELLKDNAIEVVTETSSKLINRKNIKAVIEYFKYIYFSEEIYARNFCALASMEYKELEIYDYKNTPLITIAKNIIKKYELYDGDINYFKFLEVLSSYKDIEQFIYEYERVDASAVKIELHGVRVLTVHKSKGLEFKHVIMLDRLSRPMANRGMIIYDYDGINLNNIYLRQKNRDFFDAEYDSALLKDKKLSDEDKLNALYVAFTRAENSLMIIQKTKESDFNLLSLSPFEIGEIDYKSDEVKIVKEYEEFNYMAESYGVQSELVKSEDEQDDDLHAIEFGLALHYTLEMSRNFDVKSLENALISTKNRFGSILEERHLQDIKNRALSLICDEKFKSLLVNSTQVHKERAFTFNKELRYIDLLIEKDDEFVIIDYKSAKNYHDKYVKQVGFYKNAIKEISEKKVSGYICYMLVDKIEFIQI